MNNKICQTTIIPQDKDSLRTIKEKNVVIEFTKKVVNLDQPKLKANYLDSKL